MRTAYWRNLCHPETLCWVAELNAVQGMSVDRGILMPRRHSTKRPPITLCPESLTPGSLACHDEPLVVDERGEEMTTGTNELVTRQEAARLAGVHVNTIRLWEESERLHPVKQSNGRVMIPLSELEDVVKDRQQQGASDHDRLIELEADNRALIRERDLLSERLEKLEQQHAELLAAILRQVRGSEGGAIG